MAAPGWRKISHAMLVLASSEAEQKAYLDSMGFPVPIKDDLAEDFSILVEVLDANGRASAFSAERLEIINRINCFFGEKSGTADPDFWQMGTASCIAGWEEVRAMAKAYLALGVTDEPEIFAAQ
ncbi:MAG: hypothetical protein AAF127_10395 [Pseudomonadota bacterium]